MMVITELKSKDNIKRYQADGLIFSFSQYATIASKMFSLEEIEEIVLFCKKKEKTALLKIDKIIEEHEVDALYAFLDRVILLGIDYYLFTDFAVLQYFKKKQMMHQLIYVAKTMNTNAHDCAFYHTLGIKMMPSHEINLEAIKQMVMVGNVVLDGYGFSSIFYTKRKLLTLFNQSRQLDEDYTEQMFMIEEETRDNRFPIYENNNGTFVFTDYKYVIYDALPQLSAATMFKIESLFLDEESLFAIIAIYKNTLDNGVSESDKKKLLALDSNINSGFLYKQSLVLGDNRK